MPFEVMWYLQDRILWVSAHGELSLADFCTYNTTLETHLSDKSKHVHIIISLINIQNSPLTVKAVADSLLVYRHKMIGWNILIVDKNVLTRFFASTLGQLYKLHFTWAEDFDHALDLLIEKDSVLHGLFHPDSPLDITSV